jgi:hypothetical protein
MKKVLSLVLVCALCLAGAGQSLAVQLCTTPGTIRTLAGTYTSNIELDSSCDYKINGRVVVTNGAIMTIEAGTVLYGSPGTGSGAGWLLIDTAGNNVGGTYAPGARIIADGTAADPIIFTSEAAYLGNPEAPGQWGGLTIVGNANMSAEVTCYEVAPTYCPGSLATGGGATNGADNSGILDYVQVNNSGKLVETDKEINGLSLVGVGSGTQITNVTVNRSDDDCIEIWGGTVNLSNCTTDICTDDQFDTDDGYNGIVTNLTIYQDGGNAALERSGSARETYNGLTITQVDSAREGVLYFKESNGIGGTFVNVRICDEDYDPAYGVFHTNAAPGSLGTITMNNIDVNSNSLDFTFSAPGTAATAAEIKAIFDACAAGSGGGSCAPAVGTCSDNPLPCP